MKTFDHKALNLKQQKKLIYTAMSKHLFYYRMFISAYVLEQGGVPLNPFTLFDYFMSNLVDRDTIREANNNVVRSADELWVFGTISNGVLAEIKIAKEQGKRIKYFAIEKPHKIIPTTVDKVSMESDVKNFRSEL